MLHHIEHRLNQLGQIGRLAAALGAAAKFEQALRDRLAAERFLLNHFEVFRNDFPVGLQIMDCRAQIPIGFLQPAVCNLRLAILQTVFQGLTAKGDAGKGVVDFVGDARRQETDAGQPFRADKLPAALVDLQGQAAVHFLEPAGHVVERLGKLFHFVAAVDLDAVLELALGDTLGARLQIANRIEDPAVEEPQKSRHDQDAANACGADHPQAVLVIVFALVQHVADMFVDGGVQVAGRHDQLLDRVLDFFLFDKRNCRLRIQLGLALRYDCLSQLVELFS